MSAQAKNIVAALKAHSEAVSHEVATLEWKLQMFQEATERLHLALTAMSSLRGQMAKPLEDPVVAKALRMTDDALSLGARTLENGKKV